MKIWPLPASKWTYYGLRVLVSLKNDCRDVIYRMDRHIINSSLISQFSQIVRSPQIHVLFQVFQVFSIIDNPHSILYNAQIESEGVFYFASLLSSGGKYVDQ